MGISTADGHRTQYGGSYEEDFALVVVAADDRQRAGSAAAEMQGVEDAAPSPGVCPVGAAEIAAIAGTRGELCLI